MLTQYTQDDQRRTETTVAIVNPTLGTNLAADATARLEAPDNTFWVALEKPNGRCFVGRLTLRGSTEEKMRALRVWHRSEIRMTERALQWVLCKHDYIGITHLEASATSLLTIIQAFALTVSQRTSHQVEAGGTSFRETMLESITPDALLTKGFLRPGSLAHEPDYFNRLASEVGQDEGGMAPQHPSIAIIIGQDMDKKRLALFFVVWALLGLCIGIVVGVVTGEVDVGATVGGGVLAFVAILQGACIFAHRK